MKHHERPSGELSIVMLHGIQGTSAAWVPVADSCTSHANFILPDLRGRGDAIRGNGPKDYSLSAYAKDLEDLLLGQVGDAPVVLVGWSMGVSIILEYLRQPHVVQPQGLVLLSGTPSLALAPWFTSDGEDLLSDVAEREVRLGLRQAADHDAVAWTWEAIRNTNHLDALAAFEMPTLIIHGSDDQDSPVEHAFWLAQRMPHADLYVIEGAGHGLLSNNTSVVAQKIDDFISTFFKKRIAT